MIQPTITDIAESILQTTRKNLKVPDASLTFFSGRTVLLQVTDKYGNKFHHLLGHAGDLDEDLPSILKRIQTKMEKAYKEMTERENPPTQP